MLEQNRGHRPPLGGPVHSNSSNLFDGDSTALRRLLNQAEQQLLL